MHSQPWLHPQTVLLYLCTQRTTDWNPLSFHYPSISPSCLFYHFLISLCLSPATGDSLKGVDGKSFGSSLPHAWTQWNITLRYIFRVQHTVPGQAYRLCPGNLKSSHVMLSGFMSNVFFTIQTLPLSTGLHRKATLPFRSDPKGQN